MLLFPWSAAPRGRLQAPATLAFHIGNGSKYVHAGAHEEGALVGFVRALQRGDRCPVTAARGAATPQGRVSGYRAAVGEGARHRCATPQGGGRMGWMGVRERRPLVFDLGEPGLAQN